MLTADIQGDSHPKTVTIVSDDSQGENAALVDNLREAEWTALADEFENTPLNEDHELRVTLNTEDIGEFIDFLEFADDPALGRSEALSQLHAMRQEATEQAEEAMAQES